MIRTTLYTILVSGLWFIAGCGTTDSNDNGNGNGNGVDPPVTTFSLTTSVSPNDDAGTVNPSSGSFEEGSTIEVEADANNGWEFENWTGGITSDDNPLSFTIENDINLTANFRDIRSIFVVGIMLQDDENQFDELMLGQEENGITESAPPAPPEGSSLHGYFERDGEELFTDIRPEADTENTWHLHFQIGNGDELTMTWAIAITNGRMHGTLIMTDPDETIEIDMRDPDQENSFVFSPDDYEYLIIRYHWDTD